MDNRIAIGNFHTCFCLILTGLGLPTKSRRCWTMRMQEVGGLGIFGVHDAGVALNPFLRSCRCGSGNDISSCCSFLRHERSEALPHLNRRLIAPFDGAVIHEFVERPLCALVQEVPRGGDDHDRDEFFNHAVSPSVSKTGNASVFAPGCGFCRM